MSRLWIFVIGSVIYAVIGSLLYGWMIENITPRVVTPRVGYRGTSSQGPIDADFAGLCTAAIWLWPILPFSLSTALVAHRLVRQYKRNDAAEVKERKEKIERDARRKAAEATDEILRTEGL